MRVRKGQSEEAPAKTERSSQAEGTAVCSSQVGKELGTLSLLD